MENKDTKLTDDQVDLISEMMNGNLSNENLKVLADLSSNNGVFERTDIPEEGYEETVQMSINPDTGEMLPTNETIKNSLDMTFEDIEKSAKDIDDITSEPITEEDITATLANDHDVFEDLDISREDTIELLRVVQRVQNKEKFNIFKALPKSVQDRINEYLDQNGVSKEFHAPEANNIRNTMADAIINEFIDNVSIQKVQNEYTQEMNKLQEEINNELADICTEYDKDRTKYIEKLMEDTDDPEKKEIIGNLLDAINDAFKLTRIKNASKEHTIVIKKFESEKPEKIFSDFLYKYNKPTPNIYSIFDAAKVLYRHTKNDGFTQKEVNGFLIAFCKFCQNYKPDNALEHAFMYYFIYDILVLDIYKGEEYTKYATEYKKNMKEVLDVIYIK